MRATVRRLRRELGEHADDPTYNLHQAAHRLLDGGYAAHTGKRDFTED